MGGVDGTGEDDGAVIAVAVPSSGGAGGTDQEGKMEIRPVTPRDMHAAAMRQLAEITPAMLEAGEEIFIDWMADNRSVIVENGGYGDFSVLATALWAAWKNS